MVKFVIIDGNSIMNRAFYGLSGKSMLSTKEGFYTNALYGFLNILMKLLETEKPTHIAVAFDLKAPTFRHKIYSDYKGHRKPTPVELIQQMPVIKEILDAMNIFRIEKEGYEADDIIGTLAKKFANNDVEVCIVSGDRDGIQLIDSNIKLSFTSTKAGKAEQQIYNTEYVLEKYGVYPKQMIDVKSLMGDSSDNIPGVPGIGEKTALDLIKKYESLQNIYDKINEIEVRDRIKNLLIENKELAELSKKLAIIDTEVPLDILIESFQLKEFDTDKLFPLLQKLEFNSILSKLNLINPNVENKKELNINYDFITENNVSNVLNEINNAGECAYYTMIDKNKNIIGISFCIKENKNFYLRFDKEKHLQFIKDIFENESIRKYTFNSKADLHLFDKIKVKIKNIAFDIMLAEYVLDAQNILDDISFVIKEKLNIDTKNKKEFEEKMSLLKVTEESFQTNLFESITENIIIDENVEKELIKDSIIYSYCMFKLTYIFQKEIEQNNQVNLYYNIELPLIRVLYFMEYTGFTVNLLELNRLSEEFKKKINELTIDIIKLAGEEFNINSSKQLGVILFEKLGLPTKRKNKTGYSTDMEVLEEIYNEHPIIELILEYRQLTKLKSTYVDGMSNLINPKDSKIHSNFNQMITTTGRISSTEPNLQNIPIRYEMGKQIRKAFIPSEGCILVTADYSQIELRILAHITGDENMIEAFTDKIDIHKSTAMKIFGVDEESVTGFMRTSAKAVNFGIIYGKGDYSLAKDLGISRKQAKDYIDEYLNQYPNVKKYMLDIVNIARQQGYVDTMFGRRRYIREINSSNYNIRSAAERMALNSPIQGTAADIIKIAMVKVYKKLKEKNLKSKLILQVHDELIIDTFIEEEQQVKELLKNCMENAANLKVNLDVDINSGKSWFEAK